MIDDGVLQVSETSVQKTLFHSMSEISSIIQLKQPVTTKRLFRQNLDIYFICKQTTQMTNTFLANLTKSCNANCFAGVK